MNRPQSNDVYSENEHGSMIKKLGEVLLISSIFEFVGVRVDWVSSQLLMLCCV